MYLCIEVFKFFRFYTRSLRIYIIDLIENSIRLNRKLRVGIFLRLFWKVWTVSRFRSNLGLVDVSQSSWFSVHISKFHRSCRVYCKSKSVTHDYTMCCSGVIANRICSLAVVLILHSVGLSGVYLVEFRSWETFVRSRREVKNVSCE